MANEYMVNRADLTSVANAIREKCDTTNYLVFPDEFVSSIQGMSNSNFVVIGRTTQPENPEENTIWVNTDTRITEWSFSATEPSEPSEGMVWFQIGGKNSTGINLLSRNSAFVYPYFAKQYVSGVWVTVDAKSFDGSQWVDWATYLMNGTDYCTAISGGWSAVAKQISQYGGTAAKPSVTTGDGCIKISSASGYDGIVYTTNKVDLTNYNTLVFKGSAVVSSQGYGHQIVIWSSLGTYWGDNQAEAISLADSPTNAIKTLSVANLTGSYYIGFGMFYGGSFTVEALYLE